MRISDVVGMASTPTGRGYWIARLGGQVYAFGDATKFAPFGASECDPIAAIFSNPVAQGYRLVSELGGTVPRGTAPDGATAMPAVCADPAP
jgi:hypothetical protein